MKAFTAALALVCVLFTAPVLADAPAGQAAELPRAQAEAGDRSPEQLVRIYSMSNSITAVAATMAAEEGRASIGDPNEKLSAAFMMQSPKQRVHCRALLRDMV